MIVVTTSAKPCTNTSKNREPAFEFSQPSNLMRNRVTPAPSLDDKETRLVIERHLKMSSYGPVRNVRCSVVDGVVTLFGTLPSFYMKQVAQALVCCVESVIRVENHCEVEYPQLKHSTLKPDAGCEIGECRNSAKAWPVMDQPKDE